MMDRQKLVLIGMNSVYSGLQMSLEGALDQVNDCRRALGQSVLKLVEDDTPVIHEAVVFDPPRRGRPPKHLLLESGDGTEQSSPAGRGSTENTRAAGRQAASNYQLCKEAGLDIGPRAPRKEEVERAKQILAGRRGGGEISATASAVKANWDLIRQSGLVKTGKGAPSKAMLEKARRIIARKGVAPAYAPADAPEAPPQRLKRPPMSEETRQKIGERAKEYWSVVEAAGLLKPGGAIPNKATYEKAKSILARRARAAEKKKQQQQSESGD